VATEPPKPKLKVAPRRDPPKDPSLAKPGRTETRDAGAPEPSDAGGTRVPAP